MFCEHCGKILSDDSSYCTNCGNALFSIPNSKEIANKTKEPLLKKWWFWLPIILLVSYLALSISNNHTHLPNDLRNANALLSTIPSPPIEFGMTRTIIETNDSKITNIVDIVDTNLYLSLAEGGYLIYADDDMIVVYLNISGAAYAAVSAKNGDSDKWDGIKSFARSARTDLRNSATINDINISTAVVVMNDANNETSSILFATMNGEDIYDAAM